MVNGRWGHKVSAWRTGFGRKQGVFLLLTTLFVGVALVPLWYLSQSPPSEHYTGCVFRLPPFIKSRLDYLKPGDDGRCVYLEKAVTDEQRRLGLSRRAQLPETAGMLFIFDEDGPQCIWMKDMKFNLDVLWLDENKQIVKTEIDLSPQTYPNTFCSERPARYVIELNSGMVNRLGLRHGQSISF